MSPTPALELRDVTARLAPPPQPPTLDGVSLAVAPGETLALLGPSGSGKSTLVRLLLGFVAPVSGAVFLRGRQVAGASVRAALPEERGLSVVFQDLALWPHMTVAGNLRFVLRQALRSARRQTRRQTRRQAQRGGQDRVDGDLETRIDAALAQVGLEALATRYPRELSGGEQQRVAMARALVTRPDVVLFDEPLANLDVALKAELIPLTRELLAASGSAALWVTHAPREAAALGHRVAILEAGRLTHVGPTTDWAQSLVTAPATPFIRAVASDLAG